MGLFKRILLDRKLNVWISLLKDIVVLVFLNLLL